MEFKYILKKITGTLSEEENKIFDAWYNESNKHRIYFHRAKRNYHKNPDHIEIEKAWKTVESRLAKSRKKLRYLKYAATIAITLATFGALYQTIFEKREKFSTVTPASPVKNSISIGTDKAVLTLEDGTEVNLGKDTMYTTDKATSSGERLVYKNVRKTALRDAPKNILTTPRGGQFFLVLADGTKVWCNSETRLKYPVSFAVDKTRNVELMYGEAYFEVSPSVDHHGTGFTVKTDNQEIRVLGTAFNIKAYVGEDHIATTLVEGKVSVQTGAKSERLKPGHQANLNRSTNDLSISEVDVYDEISWKNGLFSFKNKSLKDIMTVLSRWYNVEVKFNTRDKETIAYNGIFRKSQRLDQILNILRNTNEINFKIMDQTIVVE